MEESKKQQLQEQQHQLLLQMQQQQQLQHRQQQLFLMQHLQKQQQQQQQATMSRFPMNIDPHLRPPPGLIQNRPVNPFLQNANPTPNLIQQGNTFHQLQQQQMMMMQQQQQQKRPSNQSEMQFAYQDAWRVCHPDFKRPFSSLEDACERLLPYHVVADYEAEEEEAKILESDQTSKTLPLCQLWDNNIAAKFEEFKATFEEQVQDFNRITQKRNDGEARGEERLMIEQLMLQDERKACIELKSELDREMKEQEARLRMAALAQARAAESQQSHAEMMMARNPLRANAIGNHGEQQGRNMNPNEMMMLMNGWGNNNNNNNNKNNSSQKEEKEPLEEDFLNDEENENGEQENWRRSGEFDLNLR